MAKRQTDEEQNLRRKARRRLIGAIALTLVVVVVLPMVLDSEPKPSGQDIDLRIPDPDKAGEFIPGVAVSPDAMLTEGESDIASAVAIPSASAPLAVVVDKAATSQAPARAQPDAKKPTKPPLKTSTEVKPVSKVAESFVAQVGAFSNADTAKQELDKLKKLGFTAYTEQVGDMIRVRVGPYAEREKAEAARLRLEKHGLHPVVMSDK